MTGNDSRERRGPPGHQTASISAILFVLHLFFGSLYELLFGNLFNNDDCRCDEKSPYTLLVTM